MENITLELSKEDFTQLVKHVFIGNWILTSNDVKRNALYDSLLDKVLSMAKERNLIEGIQYVEDYDMYSLTQEMEEEYLKPVNEYENESFWDDLGHKLATRDTVKKHGEKKLSKMAPFERMSAIWNEEEKYGKEFEEHGITRLYVKECSQGWYDGPTDTCTGGSNEEKTKSFMADHLEEESPARDGSSR